MQILKDLNNTYEITIILVTHETVIAQYAKRQILFSDGKIISDQ
jgi:ABC-type lipoprotein export system ATPase subunit